MIMAINRASLLKTASSELAGGNAFFTGWEFRDTKMLKMLVPRAVEIIPLHDDVSVEASHGGIRKRVALRAGAACMIPVRGTLHRKCTVRTVSLVGRERASFVDMDHIRDETICGSERDFAASWRRIFVFIMFPVQTECRDTR